MYCRDNPEACRDIVVAAGSQLGDSHQLWQMNEINKLIWPAADGIGIIDQAAWDRTVEIAQGTENLEGATVLTAPPTEGAFTNDIVTEALALVDRQGHRHHRRRLRRDRGHPRRGRRVARRTPNPRSVCVRCGVPRFEADSSGVRGRLRL